MTPWEYLRTVGDGDLAALGAQGWELVAVLPTATAGEPRCYFKRPAADFRDRVTLEQQRRYYAQRGIPNPAGSAAGDTL